MGREVVQDHDVPRREGRDQHLFDVAEEPSPVHRSVQHHRRGHSGEPQRPDEGGGLPVSVRDRGAQALAAGGSAVKAGHLGRGTRLVDEHQALGVQVELALEPGAATPQDVGTILLRRMPGLFFSVIFRRAKKRQSVEIATATPCWASRSRSSTSVMSDLSSTAAKITGA